LDQAFRWRSGRFARGGDLVACSIGRPVVTIGVRHESVAEGRNWTGTASEGFALSLERSLFSGIFFTSKSLEYGESRV
jgi:hypothetical protein